MKPNKITIKKKHNIKKQRMLVKLCHQCGQINESIKELQRCLHCTKSFMPLNYFSQLSEIKPHFLFQEFFHDANELEEIDLIKGLYLFWDD